MNIKQFKILLPAINEGAIGLLTAIMNTACAVGFVSVVKVVPGFTLLKIAIKRTVKKLEPTSPKSDFWEVGSLKNFLQSFFNKLLLL